MHFEHILLTTDFSDDSKRAFDFASYDAKMEASKITLLSVVHDWEVPPEFMHDIANPEAITTYRQELLESAKERLDEYANEFFHGQEVTTEAILSTEPVAQVICRYAKEKECNVIVMSSHGKGVLGNFFLGSVVQKVLQKSGCPVLVIPKSN